MLNPAGPGVKVSKVRDGARMAGRPDDSRRDAPGPAQRFASSQRATTS
jgi:hypothetical protein